MELNATSASLLGFLMDGPKSGWDLVVTAELRIGDFWSLTSSQVYRELARMSDAGFVAAGERGRRERQPFQITPAGRTAFDEWLKNVPGPETIRFPLLLALAFGRHVPPDRLAGWLAMHRSIHQRRLDAYAAQPRPADPYAGATLDFGIRYERAVLDWFDALPESIRPRATRG